MPLRELIDAQKGVKEGAELYLVLRVQSEYKNANCA